ncbi:MAG: YkgJ family cysteine cluster protein [Desulfovibrionaceae bacterium]|nr:YkgJ family cysteine cluster protein [Desulfovibrionaceae bacterium]
MALDFTEYFKKYEAVVAEVEAVFKKFENDVPELVKCGKGCSDCCYALFDVTLVEAMYINAKFNEKYSGIQRAVLMDRADKADRQINKLKRKVFKATQSGASTNDVLLEVAKARVRCPMLDDNDLCSIYEHRPITCRLYGVPTAIGGKPHACGKSGFKGGEKYPTVNMDIILDKLLNIGRELKEGIGSRYKELGEILLPVSMAVITEFDEEYLGVGGEAKLTVPQAHVERELGKGAADAFRIPDVKDAPKSEACKSCDHAGTACESCGESIVLGGGGEGNE